ncbi:MAG: hypothetical protein ABI364_02575 [Caldimonas sp.]
MSLSDRPCGGRPATGLAAIGPNRGDRPAYSAYPTERSVGRASEYLGYLSPQCAELKEGLRNGPARGLGSRAMSELATSYHERCSEDEQNARKRLTEEQGKKREVRDNEAKAEKAEQDRVRLSREQCDEMYRIVHRRRQTLETMGEGGRADFRRFEANWKARCQPS